MANIYIKPDSGYLQQSVIMNLPVGGDTYRTNLEIMYAEKTDNWLVSLYDVQTGKAFIENVPLVASYGKYNNLWASYRYKGIGRLYCVPISDAPSTPDPTKDNLSEFYIVWSDGNG